MAPTARERYDTIQIALHWLTVLLILAALSLIWTVQLMPRGDRSRSRSCGDRSRSAGGRSPSSSRSSSQRAAASEASSGSTMTARAPWGAFVDFFFKV